jgi:hypothetical protein
MERGSLAVSPSMLLAEQTTFPDCVRCILEEKNCAVCTAVTIDMFQKDPQESLFLVLQCHFCHFQTSFYASHDATQYRRLLFKLFNMSKSTAKD